MKGMVIGLIGFLLSALACGPAGAWSHSGAYGTASGGGGSWSASGTRGGSASGGGGSWSGHRRVRRPGLRRGWFLEREQRLWYDSLPLISL